MISKIIIITVFLQSLASATPIHSRDEPIGKFPYHVSVRDAQGKHLCGAAIIKTNLILGAGLCMTGGLADHIVAGSVDPTDTNVNFTQTVKITKIERNFGFFGERYMVLFFLDNALQFGYGVQPIKLGTFDPIASKPVRISGFVKRYGTLRLRSTEQTISPYDQCKALLNHPQYNNKVVCTIGSSKSEICNGYEESSLLVCHGREFELCGLPFSNRNFLCTSDSDENDYNTDKKVYLAGFVKLAGFADWLRYFGAL